MGGGVQMIEYYIENLKSYLFREGFYAGLCFCIDIIHVPVVQWKSLLKG